VFLCAPTHIPFRYVALHFSIGLFRVTLPCVYLHIGYVNHVAYLTINSWKYQLHMTSPHDPNQNHLLAALLDAEFDRLAPYLELVPMLLGDVLYESGGKLQHVYFPTTSIVSLHYLLENGGSSEIAGVGNEGVLGVSIFMGGNTTPSRAVVQTGGHGYRLKAQILMDEFNQAGPVMRLLLRYTQALITHMSQTAVCNRHHSVEQQLCRWLLLTLDRLPTNELTMTQELIANMLGVRREGVTEAAGRLQQNGLIQYRRGHITVVNRAGLERNVCECYAVVKKEFDRLLSDVRQRQSGALGVANIGKTTDSK
jgi:CRP-like cAMP-binding protein